MNWKFWQRHESHREDREQIEQARGRLADAHRDRADVEAMLTRHRDLRSKDRLGPSITDALNGHDKHHQGGTA